MTVNNDISAEILESVVKSAGTVLKEAIYEAVEQFDELDRKIVEIIERNRGE